MFSHRGNLLVFVEAFLWIVAAGAIGFAVYVIADATHYQYDLNRRFDKALATYQSVTEAEPAPEPATLPPRPAEPLPSSFLGRLEIPRLQMSVMILDGIDKQTMRRGIGRIPGTVLPGKPGNAGIAGHRDTFFRPLASIHTNDRITIRTLQGDYHYVVDSIRVVEPGAIQVLDATVDPVLTLVTCYPFHLTGAAPKRLVVQATLQQP